MIDTLAVRARTALSPEWDRGFDEAFTDLVAADPELVRDEFDALIGANFGEPPEPPALPAPPAGRSGPPPASSGDGQAEGVGETEAAPADPVTTQRSPP